MLPSWADKLKEFMDSGLMKDGTVFKDTNGVRHLLFVSPYICGDLRVYILHTNHLLTKTWLETHDAPEEMVVE